ncbi:EAL domain-containing protein [Sulfurimonas sp.]|uniref:putative bifunctional diguanylate cyclase/phosphodiesterase n=1 Tax=Sulfurimonas sp. TaxID=2022749 RepID=UPI0025EC36EC|nr:EAL domain-containing protein [Sulfurimonas sp.]MBW6487826.1 EAL domain-containing protein [Sulfurimonas sp.]
MKLNIHSIIAKVVILLVILISMLALFLLYGSFYEKLIIGLLSSGIIVSLLLYKSLKPLDQIANNLESLNEEVYKKAAHLKDAQRIAKVGSWEYNIVTKSFTISDEAYRMLGLKHSTQVHWEDFLNFTDDCDYPKVVAILEDAIKNGSQFNMKYALNLTNNKKIYVQTSGKVRKKQDGSAKITAVSMDISNEIENKQKIEQLAYYDSLTNLANRLLLQDRITNSMQLAKRNDTKLAVMFLDLDHFKLINDTLGHGVGDNLLMYISEVLKGQVREADTVSRFGGDEFVILLSSIKTVEDAKYIAEKIQAALQQKHTIGTHQLYITTSIGVAIYPEHAQNVNDLITNADIAMYDAKNSGRNCCRFYQQSMGKSISKRLNIEQDLAEAIKSKNGIEVYYQAKIDTITNEITGAEALVRWVHQRDGLIYPDEFIYIAESTGLMIELGYLIIENAVLQAKALKELGFSNLVIAINLSLRQFQDVNLVAYISSIIKAHDISPSQLEFEITESISMYNLNETLRILTELSAIGVSIAIDDFGTGHSSLLYLKKFPIKTLKIDRSFVMDMTTDNNDRVIAQTIILMAKSLNLSTVAEGVETLEQANLLKKMGCNQLQGYFFSKPISKEEFTKFLQTYI